ETEGTRTPEVDGATPITSSDPEETPAPTVEAVPVTSPEPEELPKEFDLSAEPLPAEPEPETPTASSEAVATAATPEISDATSEEVVTPSEPMESSEPTDLSVPQVVTDTPPEGPGEPIAAALDNLTPEAPAPAAPPETSKTDNTPHAQEEMLPVSFLPDMTSFIQHLDEPAPLSSLPSNDSLLDPAVADLLIDKQENRHTGDINTATPNRKNSGKRAAMED
ncbi:MAG TPA: hypothetical protein VKB35_00330, partial [Ktedonobacteraceae bacterium]|nr:hypothetical protein [Ktedonobacteraceae bacterium]